MGFSLSMGMFVAGNLPEALQSQGPKATLGIAHTDVAKMSQARPDVNHNPVTI